MGTPLPGVEVRIAKFVPGQEDYQVLCEGNNTGTKVMPGCEDEVSPFFNLSSYVSLKYTF